MATRTSGSEGGPGRRTGRKAATAPRADPYAEKVRAGGRVVSKAVVIAFGVHESGRREILGFDVGEAETEAFWTDFLRSLIARGLTGVQLVTSDAHGGLKAAIARLLRCPWQRCTVHFLRDCLGHARRDQHGLLAALIRPVFQADSGGQARGRLTEAIAALDERLPKDRPAARRRRGRHPPLLRLFAGALVEAQEHESARALQQGDRRRTDVVGIFPDDRSLTRLVGMLCLEQSDEWLVGRRYLSASAMEPLLEQRLHRDPKTDREEVRELTTARAAERPPDEHGLNSSYTTCWDLARLTARWRGFKIHSSCSGAVGFGSHTVATWRRDPRRRRAMAVGRRIGLFIAAACLAVAVAAPTVSAHYRTDPVVTRLAEFGSDDFVIGSTIGPGGALYVTDGVAGAVLRIDRRSGRVATHADGLPPKAFPGVDIGGPVDVAFAGRTAYVLVTLVSGTLFGEPFGDPEAENGLYRIGRDGSHTLVADLGQWSVDNPPEPAFFVDTGVHFALEPYRGGFLVTDGHHNRVLWVDRHGSTHELAAFGNVVPTGLETAFGRVFVTQMGPIPHRPEDGKVIAVRAGREPREVASGASMLIDVERGPHRKLYGLSQGQWDGVGEGSRAEPDTGRLVVVGRHGDLTPVVDRRRRELVLDRPTSLEFVGTTAYVVSVTGVVYRVDGL